MKFLKLEILNLASLDNPDGETIDFEHGALAGSNIFSIVGPTGSGKSTLLDAICLALYNRAPRYPRKKGERNQGIEVFGTPDSAEAARLAPTDCRNILTRGRKHGYSKLTFAANNGSIYRAEWHVRFQRVRYENTHTLLFCLKPQPDGTTTEEEADWNGLADIIGLDYDQFLRTVLIAQGAFANFLTAKENDRYELLERLIGCEDTYKRISDEIDKANKTAADRLKETDMLFAAFEKDDLSDDALTALNQRIAEKEEEARQRENEANTIRKQLDWYVRDDELAANAAQYESRLKAATAAADTLKDKRRWLGLHDAAAGAVAIYKDIVEARATVTSTGKAVGGMRLTISSLEKEAAEAAGTLTRLKAEATACHDKLETMRPHINKARTLSGELAIEQKNAGERRKAMDKAMDAKKRADEACEDNKAAIAAAEESAATAAAKLRALTDSTQRRSQELRAAARAACDACDTAAAGYDATATLRLQEGKDRADKLLADLRDAVRLRRDIDNRQQALQAERSEQERLTQRNAIVKASLDSTDPEPLRQEIDTLRHTLTLMTSDQWQAHRRLLGDGEPCPLCGALNHPFKSDGAIRPVAGRLKSLIDDKEAALAALCKKKDTLTKEYGENDGKLKLTDKNIRKLKTDIAGMELDWTGMAARRPEWHPDATWLATGLLEAETGAAKASASLTAHNRLTERLSLLRKAKDDAEKSLATFCEKANNDINAAAQKATDANTKLEAERSKSANLKAQCKEKAAALADAENLLGKAIKAAEDKMALIKAETGSHDPDKLEQALLQSAGNADNAVNAKADELTRLNAAIVDARAKADSEARHLDAAAAKCRTCQAALAAWIDNYNATEGLTDAGAGNATEGITTDTIAALFNAGDDWEQTRRRLRDADAAVTSARTTLGNELAARGKHMAMKPRQERGQLATALAALAGTANDNGLVELKARRQRCLEARKQMGGMHARREAAAKAAAEWASIAEATGTNGRTLRKIAQCYTMRFLVAHANSEIRRFNNRYELVQVRNSLGIRVVDHDRADDIRDVTSLSGGETFIVSLGLALGLSSLSSRNVSFDNLFIDEGFGTLDPDSLATVIDSLAMLQTAKGKKVGVISHTDTMSERITTQIRVVKNGNTGSSHIEIYP